MSKNKEICKYSAGGQWSLSKNINQSYANPQNSLEMSEKGVHSQADQAAAYQAKGVKRMGGVSEAGADYRRGEPAMARVRHKENLADIKKLPAPKLPNATKSETEMRSKVSTNRQQDVRVKKIPRVDGVNKDETQREDNLGASVPMGKKDPSSEFPNAPQRADNIKANGGAIKAEMCKYSSHGQWSLITELPKEKK